MNNLHLEYKIIGQGDTVIAFENGLGGYYYDWSFIIDEFKNDAEIIAYHRAGYGNSTSLYPIRTTKQIAKELDILLNSIGVTQKLILVGHSFGGLCVQQYARMYPDRIKGVILVDSTSMNFNRLYELDLFELYKHITIDKMAENWERLSSKTAEELKEMMDPVLSKEQLELPREYHQAIIEFGTDPTTYKTMAAEVKCWAVSSELIKSSGPFPDVPLFVIARDSAVSVQFYIDRGIPEAEAIKYENTWRELQLEHAKLSSKAKFIVADGSDHNIQLEKPGVIIECLRELLKK